MNKEIKNLFELLASELGIPTDSEYVKGKGYKNEFLKLDFNSIYGGYRLDIVQKNTGGRFFTISERLGKKEMAEYLRGFIDGLRYNK